MSASDVTMVRVYLHESTAHMEELLKYLHDESKVRGVTVFRGITGFGNSGKYHSSKLIDMSLDLPVVIEFYDTTARAMPIIEHLKTRIKPGHIVYWPAQVNE
jgi:PII-like signaling protein